MIQLAIILVIAATSVMAAPVTVFYSNDAEITNNVLGGTQDHNMIFSTPVTGITALSYTQAPETVMGSANGFSASSTYSATISPGLVKASSSSSTTGIFSGSAGEGITSSATQAIWIQDTLTANGGAAGQPVNLTLTLQLDTILSFYNVPTSSGTLCGYGSITLSAAINLNQVDSVGRDLCTGGPSQTATATFNVTSGTPFDLKLRLDLLTQSAIGAGDRTGSGVSIDALDTGMVFLQAPQGVQLSSTSGHSYAQVAAATPEPGTLALAFGAGLFAFAARVTSRRSKRNAHVITD